MFPALYCCHRTSALSLIKDLHISDREYAILEASKLILRKLPPADPYYNHDFDTCKISHEDVTDLFELMDHVSSDSILYLCINALAEAVAGRQNQSTFSAQQKADYANRIRVQISKKLPDPRNIKHIGYQLICMAQTYRLEDVPHKAWQALWEESENISNIADRGFVYVEIADCLPGKYEFDKKRLLNEALNLFYQIPSPIDRLTRLELYSNASSNDSISTVKEALKNAIVLTLQIENEEEAARHRRNIVDTADRLEPGFANELIDLMDKDPARQSAKSQMVKSNSVAKAKREIANAKSIKDTVALVREHLPDAAWKNVAALLAGRLETKSTEVMSEYAVTAGSFPLRKAYPILSWYIENSARRYVAANDAAEHLFPICEALILSTEIATRVIAHSSKSLEVAPHYDDELNPEDGLMVRPGTREDAVQFIKVWLRANAVDYIKFCDPYFGPSDIEFLRVVLSESPTCKVSILTSKEELVKKKALDAEPFLTNWNKLVDQDPPETEIIAAGMDGNEKKLIHDRWLLTRGAGLRIGTSFNSLGQSKLSEISVMEPSKVASCEHLLNKFFARNRVIDGIKVNYISFTL